MAVPSAVRRQRERLEAELGLMANPDGTPPADPSLSLVPPSPPDPAPQLSQEPVPQAQPSADPALTARIAELEHLLKTRDGQTSKSMREADEARSRMELLASQVASLEEALAEVQKQKETAEARAQARQADSDLPSLEDVPDLSPQEIETFGQDSVGFVNKLSKRQLVGYVKPLFAKVQALEKALARLSDLDELPRLKQDVQTAKAETQRVKDEEFFREEVLKFFPDFVKTRDTQEWKDYVATDIPGKGIKVGHLLNHYRLSHDAANIRSVIQGYYDQVSAKPSLSSLAVPPKTQTEGQPVQKPKMKASLYKEKLKLFTQRQLARADWDKFKTEFNTALAENRVDMDIRL